jgi:hypothetical protein
MAQKVYLQYTIWLTDPAEVTRLQTHSLYQFAPLGVVLESPDFSADHFNAPLQIPPAPFVAPCITSEWFGVADYPTDERSFMRRTSGVWGFIISLFGAGKTKHIWIGKFALAPVVPVGESAIPGEVPVVMSTRRFIDGFEGTEFIAQQRVARSASRHLQGMGYMFDNTVDQPTHTPGEATGGAPIAVSSGWDRFYMRVRRYGTSQSQLWSTLGYPTSLNRIYLMMNPGGTLAVVNASQFSYVPMASSTLAMPPDVWHKVDILWKCNAADAFFKVFVNGVPWLDLTPTGFGIGELFGSSQAQRFYLGGGPANGFTWHVDDWVQAELPAAGSNPGIRPGHDWNHGSRVALISATGFAADHNPLWVGNWRILLQRPMGASAAPLMSTSTSGARLSITTDASIEVDRAPGALGIAAMVLDIYSTRGTAQGKLGFKLPGAAEVLTSPIDQTVGFDWLLTKRSWYLPVGLVKPLSPLGGLELIHDAGLSADLKQIRQLTAQVEVIGNFGPEDVVPGAGPEPEVGSTEEPPPSQTSGYVAAIKAQVVAAGLSTIGDCGAFEITRRVAWGLRAQQAGLLDKHGGAECTGFAPAIVAFPDGRIADILIGAGDSDGNTPTWNWLTPVDKTRYRAPTDPGDMPLPQTQPGPVAIHNAPYPYTPWARPGVAGVVGPVVVDCRTYVGTGTFIDIAYRCPVHFLWIRNTVNGRQVTWWSSCNAGHAVGEDRYSPSAPVRVTMNYNYAAAAGEGAQAQETLVQIAGGDTDYNGVGVTYEIFAFCDPAMRFCEMTAFNVTSGAADFDTRLTNEAFTPEAMFIQREPQGGNTSGSAQFFKGLGHSANNATYLGTGTEYAVAMMGAGVVTSKFALYVAAAQNALALFRRDDGRTEDDPEPVVWIQSYVGNGSASRTIPLLPACGRRPIWALIVPHNALAIMRDPGHTGTTSTDTAGTANASTGIIGGGLDEITVGSTLNVNATIYEILAFVGCDTAGNNGWSVNCEHAIEPIVPPEAPPGPDCDDCPPVPPEEPGGPELPPPTVPGFGGQCLDASTVIINRALAHIGVGKQILDIVNELSPEATQARLHYQEDVEATLRDFPWGFATKYARLAWVSGTELAPTNGDWVYAFRVPADSVFNRRLVDKDKGRGFDPAPLLFRIGSDPLGPVLYTNDVYAGPTFATDPTDVYVELEYTYLPLCAATAGDAIFRSALAWRHAHSIAPVLSKDEKKVAFCWSMYELMKAQGTTKAADEEEQADTGDADWIRGRE